MRDATQPNKFWNKPDALLAGGGAEGEWLTACVRIVFVAPLLTAYFPADAEDLEQLLHETDKQLIRAKNAGRNRVVST